MHYLLVFVLCLVQQDTHSSNNPVLEQLIDGGIEIVGAKIKLPTPTMADGLAKDAQTKIITDIGGKAYPYDKMMRRSTVAPHIARTELKEEGSSRYRTADFWFVAYGKLEVLTDQDVLDQILSPNKEEGSGEGISDEELRKRGIEIDAKYKDQDGYGHLQFVLEKRVELNLTGRAFYSKTDDSIVAAILIDPRFKDDDKLANVWKPLKRADSGKLEAGEATAYRGMGLYLKITRLEGVEDGLFVESHIVFNEPVGWFDGRNYLGSKLPPIISKQVRTMRAELAKASQK